METKLIPVVKAVNGIKTYVGSLIGTANNNNLISLFMVNCAVESQSIHFLKAMANEKGEVDIEVIKRNAIDMLEKMPGKEYVVSIPMIGKLTINKKAIEDCCAICLK